MAGFRVAVERRCCENSISKIQRGFEAKSAFRQELLLTAWQQVQRYAPAWSTAFITPVYPHWAVTARQRARAVVIDAKPGQVERAIVAGEMVFFRAVLTPRLSLDAESDDDVNSPLRAERWRREEPKHERAKVALTLKVLEQRAVQKSVANPPKGQRFHAGRGLVIDWMGRLMRPPE